MELIINSGQGRSFAYEALGKAKEGSMYEAEQLMIEAKKCLNAAHSVQTQLISFDEGTGKIPVNLLMAHAQDHLMSSMLAKELVAELIDMYKKFNHLIR